MVRKTGLTILMVLAMLAGMIILPQTAAALSLKQNSVVSGDTITLGDVFRGLNSNHEKVLGLAPQPGQEMVLNARTLLRIAIALDLPWRPITSTDQITITRAATIIDRSMIEDALRAEIEKEGVHGKYSLNLPAHSDKIVLAPDLAASVEVTKFSMNQQTGAFEATLAAPSAAESVHTSTIKGSIHKMVDVPVLRGTIKAGDVIGTRDIDFIQMKESELRHDMVTSAEEMIGMTPRRMTSSGKPLNMLDLESPQIVARGDTVTMLFTQGGMTLTASGKAMQNGAKGDMIRVTNIASNKTIEGFVTADREVTVKSF